MKVDVCPADGALTLILPCVFLLCRWRSRVLFGAEGISDRKKFTFRQGGEEQTNSLHENISRHLALFHQPRCKLQILKWRAGNKSNWAQSFLPSSGIYTVMCAPVFSYGKTLLNEEWPGHSLHKVPWAPFLLLNLVWLDCWQLSLATWKHQRVSTLQNLMARINPHNSLEQLREC